jgi:FAD/FMN-containing dehydrogenase
VFLNNTSEVSETLKVIKETGTKFAIRTTGHNPNPGFSSVDETGIVIDLRNLKSIALVDGGIVQVGAGNTWGDIFAFVEDINTAVVGARYMGVGISGFLLGGGMPAFVNLAGYGADNVKNFEVRHDRSISSCLITYPLLYSPRLSWLTRLWSAPMPKKTRISGNP